MTGLLAVALLSGCAKPVDNNKKTVSEKEEKKSHSKVSYLPTTNKKFYRGEVPSDGKTLENGFIEIIHYEKKGNLLLEVEEGEEIGSYVSGYRETKEGLYFASMYLDEEREEMLLLPYPFKKGLEWDFEMEGMKAKGKVLSIDEKLVIDGKEYKNIVKVFLEVIDEENDFKQEMTVFLGEGMGMVKYAEDDMKEMGIFKIEDKKSDSEKKEEFIKKNGISDEEFKIAEKRTNLTAISIDFHTHQVSIESYMREIAAKGMNIKDLNTYIDKELQFNEKSLESGKLNNFGKPYKINVDAENKKTNLVTFDNEGNKYVLSTYYHEGRISTCTSGFGNGKDIKNEYLEQYDSFKCGYNLKK